MTWYLLLIGAVAVERLAEVVVAQRNRSVSREHGGVEFGALLRTRIHVENAALASLA